MRTSTLTLATALALAATPAAAWGATGGFRLPSASPTPSQSDRQGPVAPDVPESRGGPVPAPTPTPRPSPTAATPAPTPAPVVAPSPRVAAPVVTRAPAPRSPARATALPTVPASNVPATPSTAPPEAVPQPAASSSAPFPSLGTATPAPAEPSGGFPWWWAIAGTLLAALAGAAVVWRARQGSSRPVSVPTPVIERPHVVPQPAAPMPESHATPPPAPVVLPPAGSLQLALEPVRLSLTLLNASLAYRLEIANHGTTPLDNLTVAADMISAHASMTREQQLTGPVGEGPVRHTVAHLAPGDSVIVEGEFRLPFPQIVPIRQGSASLMLPLARFRAAADGTRPVVRTFAIGQPGAAGLQMFRLDQGPRVYPQLVQRAFA